MSISSNKVNLNQLNESIRQKQLNSMAEAFQQGQQYQNVAQSVQYKKVENNKDLYLR